MLFQSLWSMTIPALRILPMSTCLGKILRAWRARPLLDLVGFPDHGDLYLEAVYRVAEAGTFNGAVDSTDGLLIGRSEYSYVELFVVPGCVVGDTQTQEQL
jgi:hypothetical protein